MYRMMTFSQRLGAPKATPVRKTITQVVASPAAKGVDATELTAGKTANSGRAGFEITAPKTGLAQGFKLSKNTERGSRFNATLKINWPIYRSVVAYKPRAAVQAVTTRPVGPQLRPIKKAPHHTAPRKARPFYVNGIPVSDQIAEIKRAEAIEERVRAQQNARDAWLAGLRLKGARILRAHQEHKRARDELRKLITAQLAGLNTQWARTAAYWAARVSTPQSARRTRRTSAKSVHLKNARLTHEPNWLASTPTISPANYAGNLGSFCPNKNQKKNGWRQYKRQPSTFPPPTSGKEDLAWVPRPFGSCYLRGINSPYKNLACSTLRSLPHSEDILRFFSSNPLAEDTAGRFKLVKTSSIGESVCYHLCEALDGRSFSELLRLISPQDVVGADEAVPKASRTTPPIEALGGVHLVPTSLPPTVKAAGFDRVWNSSLWPTQATDVRAVWNVSFQDRSISMQRTSEFTYHYPSELNRALLPSRFEDYLLGRWAYKPQRGQDFDELFIPTNYSRHFTPTPPARNVLPEFESISDVLNGSLDMKKLDAADNAAAFSRALGSRGQRVIPGWEAAKVPRWQRLREFAMSAENTRQYFEMAYRLISRYIAATAAESMNDRIPNCSLVVDDTSTNIEIIHINAETILPPPPQQGAQPQPPLNGEAQFWTYPSQHELLTGRAQFIDGEGLSREEIAQLIAALAPSGRHQTPYLRRIWHGETMDIEDNYVMNVCRHTFPNDVVKIFVHHGSSPTPLPANGDHLNPNDAQWIIDHAFDVPDPRIIGSLIRALSSRHDLSDTFEEAYDAVMYRTIAWRYADGRTTNIVGHTYDFIDASGYNTLYLPRNNTRYSYFDIFFMPTGLASEMERFLARSPDHQIQIATLISWFRAVAINWAAKSLTLDGNSWRSLRAGGGNQFVRNHIDKWVRKYYNDPINLWSSVHANAMAHQYGFAPSAKTRMTEESRVVGWWSDYASPYLANHYYELWAMQTMPTFQVLPYYDPEEKTSHVQWAPDAPKPAQSWPAFNETRSARLAREMQAYPGYGWLGDGGAEYNIQFYVAQGNHGEWAKDGGISKALPVWWEGEYTHTLPGGVNAGNLDTLSPVNTPWADFVCPGSLRSHNLRNNRIINWGVRQNNRVGPLTSMEAHRWWRATMGKEHISLMVNYISPITERREIDAISDYSVTLWESGNNFAGLTFSNFTQDVQKADGRFSDLRPKQQTFESKFDSKPSRFSQHQPALTTRKAGPQPSTKASMHFGKLVVPPGQALNDTAVDGDLQFENKYPHHQTQVPRLQEGTVEHERDGFHSYSDPAPPPRLSEIERRVQAHKAELDKAFAEYLAESSKYTRKTREDAAEKEATQRERATQRALGQQSRGGKSRITPPRSSDTAKPGKKEATFGNTKYQEQASRRTKQDGGLTPNDSPAAQAQSDAQEIATKLLAMFGNPAAKTAGSRRPTSPPRPEERPDSPEDWADAAENPDPYDDAAQREDQYDLPMTKGTTMVPPGQDPSSVKPPIGQYRHGEGGSANQDFASQFYATMHGANGPGTSKFDPNKSNTPKN